MKNLNDKQKKVFGWVVLIVSFLWNTIYSFFIFIFVSLGEIFRYFYNDSFFGMLDSATYLSLIWKFGVGILLFPR